MVKDPRPAQEALSWMILLQEDVTDENTQSAFDAWLNEDPANREEWLKVSLTTDIMHKTVDHSPDLSREIEAVENPPSKFISEGRGLLKSASLKNLATLIGVFILGVMLLSYLPQTIQFARADHSTAIGERHQITLADGSHVYLGARSALNVDFTAKYRRVKLLSGQAFFEVEKNPSRPFIVLFDNNQTIVTGTAFEVNMSRKSAIVSVDHGSVRVSSQEQAQRNGNISDEPPFNTRALNTGESIEINNVGDLRDYALKPRHIAAWRKDLLVVSDKSVRDVIDELKRHYKGLVVNGLGSIGNKRITGVYDLKDPAKVLQTIAATHGAKARQLSKWIIVLSQI